MSFLKTISTKTDGDCDAILKQLGRIIIGKPHQLKLAVACLLARGHLLITDLPGMGKTTFAHSLATVLGLDFKRIQFTSDLLPADIIGVSIYEKNKQQFIFHPGPLFTQLVLADEINRTTAKTQSALLEAMEEHQVSNDGVTYRLPEPFFVIATQNPTQLIGAFPLPESQLDRFLMCIEIGYPDRQTERLLLNGHDGRDQLIKTQAAINIERFMALQQQAVSAHCSDALLEYIQNILDHSRHSGLFENGLSPRAGIGLVNCARAWATLEGRDIVIPEDVQSVLPHVIGHRLIAAEKFQDQPIGALVDDLIKAVAIP